MFGSDTRLRKKINNTNIFKNSNVFLRNSVPDSNTEEAEAGLMFSATLSVCSSRIIEPGGSMNS